MDFVLQKLLPVEYSHIIEAVQPQDGGFTAVVRLPLREKEDAKEWLRHFQASSFTDFRVMKTFPNVKLSKVLFKVSMFGTLKYFYVLYLFLVS